VQHSRNIYIEIPIMSTSPPRRPPGTHPPELPRCFADKAQAREAVWRALSDAKIARFPFPIRGRIPNFAGADAAAARLLSHPAFASAKCVKVNPDSPQRHVRKGLLERGIAVLTPTPRLRGGFFLLDPDQIPPEHHWDAASMKMGGQFGEPVALEQLPHIDLVVMGSVAVTREGKRLGKGHGYADLEYALLRELGHEPVPVATTVHALQILESFPTSAHDVELSIIATPEELIEVLPASPGGGGIDWDALPVNALDEMPVLAQVRDLRRHSKD
jgi:5-formyltetrahydrofolate cyclo-ligase